MSNSPLEHLASAGLAENRLSLTVGSTAAMRRFVPGPTVIEEGGAWCYYLVEGRWLLGGVIHDAGAVMEWLLRTVFGKDEEEGDLFELLNREVSHVEPGAGGLLFLVAMLLPVIGFLANRGGSV